MTGAVDSHTTDGLDCWCGPQYFRDSSEVSRGEAEMCAATGEVLLIVHRKNRHAPDCQIAFDAECFCEVNEPEEPDV